MTSESTKTNRARLWDLIGPALIVAIGVWRHWPAWLIVLLVAVDLVNPVERWKELLDALRGSRKPQEEHDGEAEYDRQIEIAHSKSEFKHIPDLPWGDPGSYTKPSTLAELEQEATRREVEERREQQARDFLNREAERILKERDTLRSESPNTKDGRMRKCNCGQGCLACVFGIPDHFPLQPGEAESLPQEPPVNNESPFEAGECLCGVPNCSGHQMIDGKIEIPNHPLGHVILHEGAKS
jgi:hypothetical protein